MRSILWLGTVAAGVVGLAVWRRKAVGDAVTSTPDGADEAHVRSIIARFEASQADENVHVLDCRRNGNCSQEFYELYPYQGEVFSDLRTAFLDAVADARRGLPAPILPPRYTATQRQVAALGFAYGRS